MDRADPCVYCGTEVRPRQEAIQCDVCALWQHRTCHTGVTRDEYWRAVRGDVQLQWCCDICDDAPALVTQHESTRIDAPEADAEQAMGHHIHRPPAWTNTMTFPM